MRMLNVLFVGVILLVATRTITSNSSINIKSINIRIKLIVSYGAYEKMGKNKTKVSQFLNMYFSQVNQIFGKTNLYEDDPINIFNIRLVPCKDNVVHDDIDSNKYNEDGVIWEYELIRQNLKESLSNSKYPMVILFTNNDIRKKSGQQMFGFSSIGQFNSEYNFAIISLFAFGPQQKAVWLVFAHEVGHLLGAKHDQFYENCSPSTIDDAYIMNEIQNFRDGQNYMKFSPCSIEDIIHHKHNFLSQNCKGIRGKEIVDQGEHSGLPDSKLDANNRFQWRNSFKFYSIFLLIISSAIIFAILFSKLMKCLLFKREEFQASTEEKKSMIPASPSSPPSSSPSSSPPSR